MDRRLVLAFVLAAAVLLLNSIFFRPQQRSQSSEPQPIASERTSPATERPTDLPEAPEGRKATLPAAPMLRDPVAEANPEEIVRVETELVEALFDPVGGSLRSWKLKRYTDAEEQPADLVRSPEMGAIWLAVRTEGRVIRTDSTRFRTTVTRGRDETQIRFVAEDPAGIVLEKVYTIPEDRYDCRLDIRLQGIGETGTENSWEIGWIDGLPLLEKNAKYDEMTVAAIALFGKDYMRLGGGGRFGCSAGGGGSKTEVREGTLRWLGVRTKYFLGALLLDEPRDRRILAGIDQDDYSASALLMEPLSYSGRTERSYQIYLGPIHYGTLASYGVGLERVQDLGPGILRPFSKLLMKFFEATSRVIPNYGFLILILSVIVRLVFYPLTKKSMESMKRMQALKPEMDRINEKYKDDPERKNREVMELYKKKKINPLGGCLPMLIQLPVLSGLYYVISNAVQLRKEPFIFWIRDLSAPDTVGHLAGFPVNPMPLIMAATMVWQQRITPTDPRQKSIGYMMPIFMTFLFYSMSSGLVFYWTVSNLMTVLQQIWMNRGASQQSAEAEEIPEKRRPVAKRGRKR